MEFKFTCGIYFFTQASGKLFYTYFKKKKHIVKNDDFQAFLLTKVIIYDNLITCEKRITVKKAMNE